MSTDRRIEDQAAAAAELMARRRAQLFLEAAAENAVAVLGAGETVRRLEEIASHLREFTHG